MGCAGSASVPSVVSEPCRPFAHVDGVLLGPCVAADLGGFGGWQQPGARFTTLLEAFRYCDPKCKGVISDGRRLSWVSNKLLQKPYASCPEAATVNLEAGRRINFPDFVEWAQSNKIDLPVGLPRSSSPIEVFPFPPTWKGPRDDPSWNRRFVVEDELLLDELQQLLNTSYRKIWTRDRKASGINRVPDEYQLESALRSENYKEWCAYYSRRLHLLEVCRSRPGFLPISASTANGSLQERHWLAEGCNEWLLFHGTSQNSARAICASDFTMDLAGSATGTLYGRGTYFAESITKADEYAKEDDDGLCCVLLCRVAGGRVLFNTEDSPDGAQVQECVLSGAADSVLGSRDVTKNTFREFVTYDVDQVYVEYVLFYRRVFHGHRPCETPGSVGTASITKSIEFAGFGVDGLELVGEPMVACSHLSCDAAPTGPSTELIEFQGFSTSGSDPIGKPSSPCLPSRCKTTFAPAFPVADSASSSKVPRDPQSVTSSQHFCPTGTHESLAVEDCVMLLGTVEDLSESVVDVGDCIDCGPEERDCGRGCFAYDTRDESGTVDVGVSSADGVHAIHGILAGGSSTCQGFIVGEVVDKRGIGYERCVAEAPGPRTPQDAASIGRAHS